ncbi:hypothetical protein [Thermithiobacillus plumbiphilus]|uniref:Uncharacterized protein n=1 Tax=Thermithiobacillus plumbiphilus TaxID=1729899 RepID=A0ABU9DA11_9PROT
MARFLGKSQRYVPIEVVLSNSNNEANFDAVRKLADTWSFRDNNVPEGQESKLISASGKQMKKAWGRAILFVRKVKYA